MTSVAERLRRAALAACVAVGVAAAAAAAPATNAPSGSRNFTPPGGVPNYFSNESGPFRGSVATQTASPGGAPILAAPAPTGPSAVASHRFARHQSVHAGRQRARLARGKAMRQGQVAQSRANRSGRAAVRTARAGGKASSAASRVAPVKAQVSKAQGSKTQGGKAQHIARARG